MTSYQDVESYLTDLKVIIRHHEKIFFVARGDGVKELGLTYSIATGIILELKPEDYVEGPVSDYFYPEFYVWVFGKISPISIDEIYIKITDRREKGLPVCLSFHKAKYKLVYIFKNINPQNNHPLRN